MARSSIIMPGTPAQNPSDGQWQAHEEDGSRGPRGVLETPITDEESMRKVAKAAERIWESKNEWIARDLAQWEVSEARRGGVANAKLIRDDDSWSAWFPTDVTPDLTPNDGKLAQLCRRFTSLLFTDPPAPVVEPPSGEEADIEAAQFSERVLLDLQSESNLSTVAACRAAFDRASCYGSGFVHYYADPEGGGQQPIEVNATPEMETKEDALSPVNPRTGGPWMLPYFTRYVRPDGTLTDEKAEAETRFVPAIRREILTGRNVRPLRATASDIWDTDGVQIGLFLPWSDVRRLPLLPYEGEDEDEEEALSRPRTLGDLPEDERKKILEYRPEDADAIAPDQMDHDLPTRDVDDRLCFVLRTYVESCPDYPSGLHLITVGACYVSYRGAWSGGPETGMRRLLPLTQFKQFDEGKENFYGTGLAEILGPSHEIRAAQIIGWLDHLEKINNQKIFLPLNSVIRPEQLQNPRSSVLYINPGGEPVYEQIPDWPGVSKEMYSLQGQLMDEASGLNEAPIEQSTSGRQAYALISQVHAGLAEPRQNIERAYVRACRIELEMARFELTYPQQLKWQGPGGRLKLQSWRGADLSATYDVHIKPGSLTLLSPAGKAAFAEHMYLGLQLISPEEMREIVSTNLSPIIAWRDDEYATRVQSQIDEWAEGPPEGWVPQQPTVVGVDPMTQQPILGPPPPDPVLGMIFTPVPSDIMPNVAPLRLDRLSRLTAQARYLRWPPEWRAGVDNEIMRLQQALAPPPEAQQGGGGGAAPQQASTPPAPESAPPPSEARVNTPTRVAAGALKLREGVPPELS